MRGIGALWVGSPGLLCGIMAGQVVKGCRKAVRLAARFSHGFCKVAGFWVVEGTPGMGKHR